MKYFKNQNDDVFAYESDGSQDDFIPESFIAITEQEANDITESKIGFSPVPASISFAQLVIGLVTEQWITETEGTAWLQGVLPAAVETLITSLPQEQQFIARARASRPSEVLRDDPLVVSLGAAQGKTEEELDDFFRTYSGV